VHPAPKKVKNTTSSGRHGAVTRNKEDGSQQISSGAIDYFYVKSVVGCE